MRTCRRICIRSAVLVAIGMAGCSGGTSAPTQAVDAVARLDVLEARAASKQPNGNDYRVSLQVVKAGDRPFPTIPERTMILSCFSANGTAEELQQELLSVAEWKWEHSTEGRYPCGAPEVDEVVWQRQRKDCSVAGFGATPDNDVCFLQTIRPIEGLKWDFTADPVLIFPLIGYDEERAGSQAPKGTAAVCLIGITGQNSVVRLSEPVILTLDPDQPNVSITATEAQVSAERRLALDGAADALAAILHTDQFITYELTFGPGGLKDFGAYSDELTELQNGAPAPLLESPAFRSLQSAPEVVAITLVPNYAVAQRTDEYLTMLGEPERETEGLHKRQTQDGFGTSYESIPARWLRWGSLIIVVSKDQNAIEAIRFNIAE